MDALIALLNQQPLTTLFLTVALGYLTIPGGFDYQIWFCQFSSWDALSS